MQSVIPGLTRNPGLPAFGGARGDQGFFWIPATGSSPAQASQSLPL